MSKKTDAMQLIPPEEFKGPKRLPDEDMEDYRKRRTVEKLSAKMHLSGKIVSEGTVNIGNKAFKRKRYIEKRAGRRERAIAGAAEQRAQQAAE